MTILMPCNRNEHGRVDRRRKKSKEKEVLKSGTPKLIAAIYP
jgi:hypothetical protein